MPKYKEGLFRKMYCGSKIMEGIYIIVKALLKMAELFPFCCHTTKTAGIEKIHLIPAVYSSFVM